MPAPHSGPRHAAPRERRTLLLPGVLLVAAGTAFAGLAVVPAAAAPVAPQRSTATSAAMARSAPVQAPAPLRAPANVALYGALSKGLAVANKPAPRPRAIAPRPAPARASRDRSPAPTVQGLTSRGFVRPGIGRLTSGFGRRWGRLHAGIDLASGIGSPIRAVSAGTVQSAGTESGYGRCVRLLHSDGTVTLYGHMSALLVRTGERVSGGEQIGREGNTGHSTGPHLHFEVHVNGSPINPIPWLRQHGINV